MSKNNDKEKNNIHKGHRERLRKQVISFGVDNWAEHQVLEFLLFFALPQKDTNELAHKLIEEYGSIVNVLEAPFESLKDFKGLGNNTASLLNFMPKLFKYVENIRVRDACLKFEHISQVVKYMTPKFYNTYKESLYMLSFDNQQRLISEDIILEGVVNKVNVDQRKIVEIVVKNNASSVIFCHNHPLGLATPSHDDIISTRKIVDFLADIGVKVLDHVIIAGVQACSMRELEYMD